MSFQSISRAKCLLDTLFAKVAEPVLAHGEACAGVLDMLADADSREVYRRELAYKILAPLLGSDRAAQVTGGMSMASFQQLMRQAETDESLPQVFGHEPEWTRLHCMACTFLQEQYRYKECCCVRKDDIVIDCGGCYGDTAVWALRKGAKQVWIFEIDPLNLEALGKTLRANSAQQAVRIVVSAVGVRQGSLYYHADPQNPGAGSVTAQPQPGCQVVPVTTIDDFCMKNGIRPSFIKMDIEGSEFDALLGAEQTIRCGKPRLAVCLYHKLEDMWTIPPLLRQWVPEYKFYCRKSHPYCEFVLFAAAD